MGLSYRRAMDSTLPTDVRWGRYERRVALGRGGMGQVYLARDLELDRDVAVKVLRADRRRLAERFRAEAEVLSTLSHPGIVPVYDTGEADDGVPYLVMKRIVGRSLRQLLDSPDRPGLHALLQTFERVCDAIGFAHRKGVLHRDLKPANIMVGDDGDAVVLDWGTARVGGRMRRARAIGDETPPGSIVGTPGYLAPEVAEGSVDRHGPPSDVFGLGSILYEMLTHTFAVKGPDRVLNTLIAPIEHPKKLRPEIDQALADLCMRCLARDPDARFPDAGALGLAVRAWRDLDAKRQEALRRLQRAMGHLDLWKSRRERLARLRREVDELVVELPRVAPLNHPAKVYYEGVRRQMLDVAAVVAASFAEVEAAVQQALTILPELVEGHALLADAYLMRYLDEEELGNIQQMTYWHMRLKMHDDGTRLAWLERPALITMDTPRPGAHVYAMRWLEDGIAWAVDEQRVELGYTPLRAAPLAPGSWLVFVQAPGRAPTRLSLKVTRGQELVLPDVRVLTDEEVGFGEWCYVPASPWTRGGDPDVSYPRPAERMWGEGFLIRRHATTAAEYAEFLAHLFATSGDWAARVPRNAGAPMWPGEPPFRFPLTDVHGDRWEGSFPVCGVSHADAEAYAAFRGARLIGDDEYEQAARGGDGRRYPWGDRYDPAVCKGAETRAGRPLPEPVGTVVTDRSPYGVYDLGGSMRTWCRGESFQGEDRLRPVRGGQWGGFERLSRAANRYGYEPAAVTTFIGIRLARPLPPVQPAARPEPPGPSAGPVA